MSKIIGNTTTTPMAISDWNQVDENKADYIKNKPDLGTMAAKSVVDKGDLSAEVQTSLDKADSAIQSLEGLATEDYVDTKVADLVDSAPETLDTLNELAAALGDDPNFATTVATEIGKKVDKVEGKGLSTNDFSDDYKAAVDNIETTISDALKDYATKTEINNLIGDIETLLGGI